MRHLHILAVSICLSGCSAILGDASSNVEGDEDYDTDECKIEGSQIGQEGYVMRLGDRRVTFQDWVTKAGEANEYMGFSLVISGDDSVKYIVKAGGERYPSSATTWSHPQGLAANAISNVDVCEECSDGSCDGGDDGGGDGGGDDGGGDDTCIECPDPGDGSGSDTGGDGPLT